MQRNFTTRRIPAANVFAALAAAAIMTGTVAAQSAVDPADRQAATTRGFAADPTLEAARDLEANGRFDEAVYEYGRVADAQRAAGVLPAEALTRVAQIHFAFDRYQQAATVLTRLANDASAAGNVNVEAQALLDLASAYQALRMHREADQAGRRLETLRRSPQLSADLRTQVDRRIGG